MCNLCKKEYQYELDTEKILRVNYLLIKLHKHKKSHLHAIWINSSGEVIQHKEIPLNRLTEEFNDIITKNIYPLSITEKEFTFVAFSNIYDFPSIEILIFKDTSEDLKSNIVNFKALTNTIAKKLSNGKLLEGLTLHKFSFLSPSKSLVIPQFLGHPISVSVVVYFLSDNLLTPKVAEYNDYLVPIVPRAYMYDPLLLHKSERKLPSIFKQLGSSVALFYLFNILSITLTFGVSILNAILAVYNLFSNYYLLIFTLPFMSFTIARHFQKQAKKFEKYLFEIRNFSTTAKLDWSGYQTVNLKQNTDLSILKDNIFLQMSKAYSSILATRTELAIKALKEVYSSILTLYSGIKFGVSVDAQAVIKKLSAELGYSYRQLLTFWDILSITKTGVTTTKISSIELMYIYNAVYEICIQLSLLERAFPNFKEYVALRKPPLKELDFSPVLVEEEKIPIKAVNKATDIADITDANEVLETVKTRDELQRAEINVTESNHNSVSSSLEDKVIELTPKLELSLDDILTLKTEEMIAHYIEDAYMSEDPVFIYFKNSSEDEVHLKELLTVFSTLQTVYPDSITLIAEVIPENYQSEIDPGQILYLDKGQRKILSLTDIKQTLATINLSHD